MLMVKHVDDRWRVCCKNNLKLESLEISHQLLLSLRVQILFWLFKAENKVSVLKIRKMRIEGEHCHTLRPTPRIGQVDRLASFIDSESQILQQHAVVQWKRVSEFELERSIHRGQRPQLSL
ncbi:hypothetical protein Agsp01_32900 [Agromyces sp. NBRC 114283]|nr:hypothetical protein Agsp01_32900 [Agromyces sp. NBRC 114283]